MAFAVRYYPGDLLHGDGYRVASTNSFGEMVIAANVIIMRVDGFAMMPNFSFGTAMTTYAGQNVGARRMDRGGRAGRKQGTLIAVGTSTTITL